MSARRDPRLSEVEILADTARRLGVGPSVVANWPTRYSSFPQPVAQFGRSKIYIGAEIDTWLAEAKAEAAGRPWPTRSTFGPDESKHHAP